MNYCNKKVFQDFSIDQSHCKKNPLNFHPLNNYKVTPILYYFFNFDQMEAAAGNQFILNSDVTVKNQNVAFDLDTLV